MKRRSSALDTLQAANKRSQQLHQQMEMTREFYEAMADSIGRDISHAKQDIVSARQDLEDIIIVWRLPLDLVTHIFQYAANFEESLAYLLHHPTYARRLGPGVFPLHTMRWPLPTLVDPVHVRRLCISDCKAPTQHEWAQLKNLHEVMFDQESEEANVTGLHTTPVVQLRLFGSPSNMKVWARELVKCRTLSSLELYDLEGTYQRVDKYLLTMIRPGMTRLVLEDVEPVIELRLGRRLLAVLGPKLQELRLSNLCLSRQVMKNLWLVLTSECPNLVTLSLDNLCDEDINRVRVSDDMVAFLQSKAKQGHTITIKLNNVHWHVSCLLPFKCADSTMLAPTFKSIK